MAQSITKKEAGPRGPAHNHQRVCLSRLTIRYRSTGRSLPARHLHDREERLGRTAPRVGLQGVEAEVASRFCTLDDALEIRGPLDGLAVDLGDDGARPHELLVARAGRRDVGHHDAADVARQAVAVAQRAGDVLVLDAQPLDAAAPLGLAAGGDLLLASLGVQRALAQLHLLLDLLAVAPDVERHGGVRTLVGHVVDEVAGLLDLVAVHRQDYVAVLPAGVLGGAALDRLHEGPRGVLEPPGLRLRVVEVADAEAQIAAADLPLLPKLGQDLLQRVDRHREADVLGPPVDGGGDAHHLTLHVEQGATGVAEVDRRVGLAEVLERVLADPDRAPLGRDDAGGHRAVEVERVADDHHPVADPDGVAVPQLDVAQRMAGVDLEQGDVGRLVHALDLGGVVPVVQVDLDRGGAFDHVVVGDHQAVGADHEAAAARVGAVLLGRLAGAGAGALAGAARAVLVVIRL